ncbi:hypothetical protein [Burkholderia ubonensis]|uniref:PAAR domain-containing protein n=1 Tax=Burkholderia ubonensis TaxID=101571 RepID=A0A119XA16_9BURK|nr:hypothetical protein [Burkholderia ubonensis]AOK62852.1 hypothetical protein WM29_27755 [Burkholderia ubonensis]KVS45295.1 hypothetical protein WK37_00760 [Burkholderia ubonensis]KVS50600.1 hypothetical protein WK38_15060 [Burkholderia ubonensis]KVS84557.1 hypothetical protein WK42_06635 [Burkholderia ubonensis]KVS84720.1 hypothetical protein WK43_24085 [Burkholderia ubonensis]
MIRAFLAQGDRAGSAVITEGLPTVTCSNPPPMVHIATLDMKTYCTACKQEGYIAPRGPRWPGTGPNGKGWALSGDINVCGCNPPPIFHAERNMHMVFIGEEAATLTGQSRSAPHSSVVSHGTHDEQYVLSDVDTGEPLVRVRYRIRTASGQVFDGVTDATGYTQRITTTDAESLHLEIVRDENAS